MLLRLKETAEEKRSELPPEVLSSFDNSFNIEYAHNSTAIEGNTLTLIQTKTIIEDGLSVGGKELREIYEVANHAKAFAYVQKCVADGKPLDENIVKDIHALLMENILVGGVYRNVEVRITGAGHKPPVPSEMYRQVKNFFADLPYKTELNAIELAAWTHAEFVRIHPYTDGNGRTSRMIMNYQLMENGFLPVSIAKENRLEYFEALEAYAVNGDLAPFAEMIAGLEQQRLEEYIAIAEQQESGNSPSLGM
ncbi:Fic family protein [Hydrogeniiclostridium mannosilyticum]|uniref:Fic family protein n=1 Tax=Hydrogeniiclostridium mannosilyticum TaxID=2764322 RepID=UPI003999689D